MGIRKDPVTGAYEFDIIYKREDWGAEFDIPTAGQQMSSSTFDKANSFGFRILSPFNFSYSPEKNEKPLFGTSGPSPQVIEDEKICEIITTETAVGVSLYLGLRLELPPGSAYLAMGLSPLFENYVIDNGEPDRFDKIYLFLKKDLSSITVEIKKSQPLIWILPIPDMAYSYQYKRKTMV